MSFIAKDSYEVIPQIDGATSGEIYESIKVSFQSEYILSKKTAAAETNIIQTEKYWEKKNTKAGLRVWSD